MPIRRPALHGAFVALLICLFTSTLCQGDDKTTVEASGQPGKVLSCEIFIDLCLQMKPSEELKSEVLSQKTFFKKPFLHKVPTLKKPFPKKPYFKKPPLHKIPAFKKHPIPEAEEKTFFKKPPVPIYKVFPPIPAYKKPFFPPIPAYKKPYYPIPKFKKPFPPHVAP